MILDACCGGLRMYHNWYKKLNDNFVYIDIRKQDKKDYGKINFYKNAIPEIKPLIRADMKHLPFKDNLFSAVIFDPPHMDIGLQAFMGQKYGSWTQVEIIRHLRAVNEEFKRVLRIRGILIMKIFEARFILYETLLTNFTFFLPITYKSQSNLGSEKVGWYMAILKEPSQT